MTININEVPTSIPTVSGNDLVAQVEAARDQAQTAAANAQFRVFDQRRPLPQVTAAIIAANDGAPAQLKWIVLGDSMAQIPVFAMQPVLQSRLRAAALASTKVVGGTSGMSSVDGLQVANSVASAENAHFDKWMTGQLRTVPVGTNSVTLAGGTAIARTQIFAGFIVQAGGGTVQWSVGGTLVGTPLDTSVGIQGSIVFLDEPANAGQVQSAVSLVVTGASVLVAACWITNSTVNGLEVFYSLGRGGLEWNDAMASAQSRANLQSFLTKVGAKLYSFSVREGLAENYAAGGPISQMFDIIDASVAKPDVICIGEPPHQGSDSDILRPIEHTELLIAEVKRRQDAGKSYMLIDLAPQFGETPEIRRAYMKNLPAPIGGSDPVHPTAYLVAAMTTSIYELFSATCGGRGGSAEVPWTNKPGRLGLGTTICRGDRYRSSDYPGLTIDQSPVDQYGTGVTFYGRALRIGDVAGTSYIQLKATGQAADTSFGENVLPGSFSFGAWDSGRKLQVQANHSGLPVVNITDAAVGGGGALLRAGGIAPRHMTKAQAATLASSVTVASNHIGLQVAVSDAANGWPLWVAVSNGAGGLKWVDSRDGTTVLS